jgi:hypothetical protein
MEKKYESIRNDNDDTSSSGEYEELAFLKQQYIRDGKKRRQMICLTFFNLFLFTISAMALTCAVVSQRSTSGHSAAKLMDQFGIFCKSKRSHASVYNS